MLPGVPWMKWALGEPRPGLGCWIGLASVPKPLAHHTLGYMRAATGTALRRALAGVGVADGSRDRGGQVM